MICVKDVYHYFGETRILNGINLSIKSGESLVLIGGSGHGKSVLLRLISKLIDVQNGSISVDDDSSYDSGIVTMLFQNNALFDSISVWENVAFPLLYGTSGRQRIPNDIKERAIKGLEEVGLSEDIADLLPHELSGGMKRRVAIARTIIQSPKVILFDEPTTGLDPINVKTINDIIIEQSKKYSRTCITVTHDLYGAMDIADKIAVMCEGQITWFGNTNEIIGMRDDEYISEMIDCTSLRQIYKIDN